MDFITGAEKGALPTLLRLRTTEERAVRMNGVTWAIWLNQAENY